MKVPLISSFLLMLGIASPLLGIERPKSLDEQLPEDQSADRAVEVEAAEDQLNEAAPQSWLGVFGESADEALSAQLGLQAGIVLRVVADDSPAAKAGLKVHDVIATVDGRPAMSQDQLRDAVQNHQPGEELAMEVVSGGVKRELNVKLGERPADLPAQPQVLPFAGDAVPRLPELRRQMEEMMIPGGELEKQMQEHFKKMEEQLRKMEQQPGLMNLQLNDLLENLPKGKEGLNVDMNMMGSVKLLDEQGSVEMKMVDGGKEVVVRDKDGNLLYEGPWDTDQDKAAVAPEIRERIDRLSFNENGGLGNLQLKFRGGAPKAERIEPDEDPAAELE